MGRNYIDHPIPAEEREAREARRKRHEEKEEELLYSALCTTLTRCSTTRRGASSHAAGDDGHGQGRQSGLARPQVADRLPPSSACSEDR